MEQSPDKPSDSALPPEVTIMLPILKELRYDRVEDIPAQRVSKDDPNYYRYKCRNNWFHSSIQAIDGVLQHIDDPSLHPEITAGIQFFRQIDWQAMRTREDIDKMNGLLEKVIHYFDQKSAG